MVSGRRGRAEDSSLAVLKMASWSEAQADAVAAGWGWSKVQSNPTTCVSGYKMQGIRINAFYSTSTVAVCVPGKRQAFYKNVGLTALERLFANPLDTEKR